MCSENIREAEFTSQRKVNICITNMTYSLWIYILGSKFMQNAGERQRYILSLSCFSCVYIITFSPVALLLSSCSTLSSFIMLYIVIFICLRVSNNFYFPPLLICCLPLVFPFYYLPVFFLQLSERPVHSFPFLPPFSCPFSHLLVRSSTVWD